MSEDVTYKLITAMRVPDHSTIAEFRRRHERALGELLTVVLALCDEAGLVEVGVISIDGMKIRANASRGANRTYEKLVADILKEAEETDRWEDGLFGADRGDEVPEQLRTEEGRRAALRRRRSGWPRRLVEVRSRRWRGSSLTRSGSRLAGVGARGSGRRTGSCCVGASRTRSRSRRSRAERLLEAAHRLEENQQVEIQASEAYERGRLSAARVVCQDRSSGCHRSRRRRRRCPRV